MRRAAREIGVFLFFLLLTIVLTWPLTRHITRFVSDLGDPLLVTAIIDWDCYALTHAPWRIYDAPFFVPARYPLAFSENFIGVALVVLPFWLAGLTPITVYNIAMLIGFALSGYGAYVLARTCGTSFAAAIAAGVLFAFTPFKFDHLPHLQFISSGWLALMFAALLAYWRTPSAGRAAALGAAFVMNALSNVHYLLFGGLALILTIALLAYADRKRDRRFWISLASALIVAGLVLLPFLVPYQIVSRQYGMRRGIGETTLGSAVPRDWLVASFRSRWYGGIAAREFEHAERTLFPGLTPLFLAGAAFFLRRRVTASLAADLPPVTDRQRWRIRWLDALMVLCAVAAYFGMTMDSVRWRVNGRQILAFGSAGLPLMIFVIAAMVRWSIRVPRAFSRGEMTLLTKIHASRFSYAEWAAALWILIGVLGSFGLNAFFHQFLYRYVPMFQSVRAPARWAPIAYLGLAVWAALGLDEIVRRVRSQSWRTAAASGLVVLAIIDMLPLISWESVLPEPAPVYRYLKAQHVRGPVFELPMTGQGVEYLYLLAQTFHRIPIMNGISGFEPPLHEQLRLHGIEYRMDDRDMTLLEQNGCRFIVVHGDWLRFQRDPIFRWLQHQLASGRLAFLRRFEHGHNGDWLFAVTRNAQDWQPLRAPEVPDAAGRTPAQNLARFFAGKHVYNTTTFGTVDTPKAWDEVRGTLMISGWAMSRNGVKRVIVHLDNDRRQFDAELVARPDIGHYFEDLYPQTTRGGFRFRVPQRPRGVHLWTDVQVEIIDGSGASTWLSDMPIWWYRK